MKSALTSKEIVGDSIVLETVFGRLKVWANSGGLYIDLFENNDKTKCIAFIDFEKHSGLVMSLFGNMTSGLATHTYDFGDLSDAFKGNEALHSEPRNPKYKSIWRN